MNRKVRVALFGYGRAGKIHFHNLRNSSCFELTTVIDIVNHEEMQELGIKFINYLDEISMQSFIESNEVEALIVASPT